jgi:hypothetical protein
MFTGQYRIPGAKGVENGITGTILHTSREEDRVTVKTRERESRKVDVNMSEFSDISLAYAVHVHKGQGLTAETSGILTGGWQTDREHAYVAVSRAREQTPCRRCAIAPATAVPITSLSSSCHARAAAASVTPLPVPARPTSTAIPPGPVIVCSASRCS